MQTQVEPTGSQQTSQRNSELEEKILAVGSKILPGFTIPDEQRGYYINLALYFAGSDKCAWDIKKGLLISGTVGTGKTLSMKIMAAATRKFQVKNTRHIVREFLSSEFPPTVIDKYGRTSFNIGMLDKAPIQYTFCFDDFGMENTNAKNYGNQINVMEDIILDRYDLFVSHGVMTHFTTNISPKLIEESYGLRLRDRLKQMVNHITLTGESKRR